MTVARAEPCGRKRFRADASPSRHGLLIPSPQAEPGVQFSRTGLFSPTRFRTPAQAIADSEPSSLFPAVRLALGSPILHVRTMFPVQAP